MSNTRPTTGQVRRWLPVLLRVVAVTITLSPALGKFLAYSAHVRDFGAYGIPWPELAVPLSGVIELLAIVSIAAGIAGRLGAGTLVVTMLVASAGIALSGTGPYSYWDPTPGDLLGLLTGDAGGQEPTKRGHRE